MSKDVIALEPDAPVGEALARMEKHGIHELPVMTNSTLRGWVSYESILRRPGINRSAHVSTVMESPQRIPKGTDVVTAAEIMIRDNVRALPVVDDKGKVVGILSRTHLLEAATRLPALASLPLERIMRRELETVPETTNVDQAAHRLRELHVNQLLVLDGQGRLSGYMATKDVLRATSAEHNSPAAGRGGRALNGPGVSRAYNVEVKGLVQEAPRLSPKATVADAVALMKRVGSTFVAVVEDGFAVGVVSRSNIVERIASLKPAKTTLCQVIGLHNHADAADVSQIYTMAQASLAKIQQELDVEFLNLHYKVYKAKSERDGDQKYSLTAHLSAGGRFFAQKADDWDPIRSTHQALDQLQRRIREVKELRLEKRKGPPRRSAAFYTAAPE